MAYRIADLDHVPDALRAAARERLEHAAAALDGEVDVDAVHTARKDLKKTRSLLRLARPAMKRKDRRRRNDALRAIAGGLAGARDADVLTETILGLHDHAVGRVPKRSLTTLAARAAKQAQGLDTAGDAAAAREQLLTAAREVDEWTLDGADRGTLAEGIALAYARGVEALAVAQDDPTSDLLHEWRKRVKDLWYHARLLKPAAPRAFGAIVKDADELAKLLGDEHDLALLEDALHDPDGVTAGLVLDVDELLAVVTHRRADLRERASALAATLYAERPKAFRKRVAAYLDPEPPDLTTP